MKKLISVFLVAGLMAYAPLSFARVTSQGASDADIWCVGPDGAEVCVDSSGNLIPTTDDDADLGTSSLQWQDIYIDGTADVDDLTVSGTATIADISVTGGILAGDLASSVMNIKDTTITSTQLIALSVTSIDIVAAPGIGYANIFLGALLFHDATSAYTGNAGLVHISPNDGTGLIMGTLTPTGFLDATSDKVVYVYPSTTYLDTGIILPDNKALALRSTGAAVAPGVSANGPVKVRAFYRVVPTSL